MKKLRLFSRFTALSLASTLIASNYLGILPSSSVNAASTIPITLEVKKIAGYSTGITDEDGGVAEIVKYNTDNQKFYVINGKSQTIDIVDLSSLDSNQSKELSKEKSINIADAVNTDSFQYGDLTSIDINTNKKIIVASVQDADYTKNGRLVVMDYDGNIIKTFEAGVQPDMVKISVDGTYILSADEGEPRMGLEKGTDPEGSVTIVQYDSGETTAVKFNDESTIDSDVHIRNNGTTADALYDLEPEYVALSSDSKKAYVSLQENNAIATIDVENKKVLSVQSLGYKDHSLPENTLDAARNDNIEIEQLPILGTYMPDSIAQVEIAGTSYLITANEGDATEWEEFVNIADFKDVKDSITLDSSLYKGLSEEELAATFDKMKNSGDYDKLEVLTDRGTDAIYTLGGRSFSIWKADTMELVYDSGSDFETITAERFPEVFNWSNDDDAFEKRSAKKGPEPEDVKVGMIGNELYAFVGLERIGGIMSYNISNPSSSSFANYINTRNFSETIAGDVSPEGLEFIEAEKSSTGRPLLIVGNEVSGTVAVYEYQVDPVKLIQSIQLDQTEVTLKVGEQLTLQASVMPSDTTENKELTWSSSDEKILSVDSNGQLTALAEGTATVTVQTKDNNHFTEATITIIASTVLEDDTDEEPNNNDEQVNNDEDNQNSNNEEEPVSNEDSNQIPNNEETENNNEESSNQDDSSEDAASPTSNEDESDTTGEVNGSSNMTESGYLLPDTATNYFTFVAYGAIIVAIGGILFVVYRHKKQNHH